jgi:hypothetical protein
MTDDDFIGPLDHEREYREWLTHCPVDAEGNERRLLDAYAEFIQAKPRLLLRGSARALLYKLLRRMVRRELQAAGMSRRQAERLLPPLPELSAGRGGRGDSSAMVYQQWSAAAGTLTPRCRQVFQLRKHSVFDAIEDPQVIGRILTHLGLDGSEARRHPLPRCAHRRSDPVASAIDPVVAPGT